MGHSEIDHLTPNFENAGLNLRPHPLNLYEASREISTFFGKLGFHCVGSSLPEMGWIIVSDGEIKIYAHECTYDEDKDNLCIVLSYKPYNGAPEQFHPLVIEVTRYGGQDTMPLFRLLTREGFLYADKPESCRHFETLASDYIATMNGRIREELYPLIRGVHGENFVPTEPAPL